MAKIQEGCRAVIARDYRLDAAAGLRRRLGQAAAKQLGISRTAWLHVAASKALER
jgi:hypothetical protein